MHETRSDGGKKSDGIKIYECVQRRLAPLRKVVRVTSLINGLLTAWRIVAKEEEQRWRIQVYYIFSSRRPLEKREKTGKGKWKNKGILGRATTFLFISWKYTSELEKGRRFVSNDSSFVQDRILRIERWISEKKNTDFRRITRRYRDGNRRNWREIGEERGTILRIYSSFCRIRRELDDGGKEK